jgi:uncharacterized integral membrane protein
MKSLKVMSIIGIAFFSLCLISLLLLVVSNDNIKAAGWGFFALLYAIPLSIVGLIASSNGSKVKPDMTDTLFKLYSLKEKGALTEEEFDAKKQIILKS